MRSGDSINTGSGKLEEESLDCATMCTSPVRLVTVWVPTMLSRDFFFLPGL